MVVITKNQARNVDRLLGSILRGTNAAVSREIFLVDSASTDNTVELALNYPVNVIRLRPGGRLTPAAGRYVGYKVSRSQYLLFLDGDMELYPGWLGIALSFLADDPAIAAITGDRIDLAVPNGQTARTDHHAATVDAFEVRHCGGAALYRRAALDDVGTFNPYLCSDEEPELCLRLRNGGHRVLRIRHPMVNHYTEPAESLTAALNRRRRGLYLGYGQILRYYIGTPLLLQYLRERGFALLPACVLMIGLGSVVCSSVTREWRWFGCWCLLMLVSVIVDAYRRGSLQATLVGCMRRLLVIEGTGRGLFLKPLQPETYPLTFDVIKRT